MSRDTPILFSSPMVRANLAGTKTQTRRPLYVLKRQWAAAHLDQRHPPPLDGWWPVGHSWTLSGWSKAKPGDRIWQRETWKRGCGHEDDDTVCVAYAASQEPGTGGLLVNNIPRPASVDLATWDEDEKWRPSIHMPRWACRFTALVKEVRIERLQDISEADAQAEGTPCYVCGGPLDGKSEDDCHCFHHKATASDYAGLWEQINGPGSWATNPWVVALTYEVVRLPALAQEPGW